MTGIVDTATARELQRLGVPLMVAEPPAELQQTLSTPLGQRQWNSEVLALQQILKYYFPAQTPYAPDGGYGVGIKNGMQAVQTIIGAPVTGVFGKDTATKLQEYGVPLSFK